MRRARRMETRIGNPFTHPTRYVSLTVAAEYLECHRATLHRRLEEGRIPYQQEGQRRRILVSDLIAYEAGCARVPRENDKVLQG